MIIEVKSCEDCPLKFDSGWEGEEYTCSIDEERRIVYNNGWNKNPKIEFKDDKEWCPLKKEDYIIKLKKMDEELKKQIEKGNLQLSIFCII